jgi:hypothetical protein
MLRSFDNIIYSTDEEREVDADSDDDADTSVDFDTDAFGNKLASHTSHFVRLTALSSFASAVAVAAALILADNALV